MLRTISLTDKEKPKPKKKPKVRNTAQPSQKRTAEEDMLYILDSLEKSDYDRVRIQQFRYRIKTITEKKLTKFIVANKITSINDLASKLGLSHTTVRRWLNEHYEYFRFINIALLDAKYSK
jgi:response regulator of citrate/malate metabolism